MTRPISSTTDTEIAKTVTRPLFLVYLGFNVPVRLSSREQITYASVLWSAASFTLQMGAGEWRLEVFNEALLLGQTVLTQGTSGRIARVYQLYGNGPYADDDGELLLDGEMGEAVIADGVVRIALKRRAPQRTPRLFCVPPTFNHIPPEGTIIRTATGTTELEPKRNLSPYGVKRGS